MAVLVGLAVEREAVGILAGQRAAQLVQQPGVADLVLGERREGDVLLEHGRDAGPLRVAEADHELVVGHGQQQIGDGRAQLRIEARRVEGRQVGLDQLASRLGESPLSFGRLVRPLLGRVELVAHHVAAGPLERAIERRLEQVRIGQVG